MEQQLYSHGRHFKSICCFSPSHHQDQHVAVCAADLDHSWILVWSSAAWLGELHRQETQTYKNPTELECLLSLSSALRSSADRGYGTCEIDWAKANYSNTYRSYIISILISCFLVPVLVMLFCYVSIINTVKRGNALVAEGDLTDRQRKLERDVTIVRSF